MNLDEIIAKLLEAKEHCVDGRSSVLLYRGVIDHELGLITSVEYNSKNVIIRYE